MLSSLHNILLNIADRKQRFALIMQIVLLNHVLIILIYNYDNSYTSPKMTMTGTSNTMGSAYKF